MKIRRLLSVSLLSTVAVAVLVWSVNLSSAEPELITGLVINEFMADNDTVLEDPAEPGEYPDWIELYNGGPVPIDLGGLYISDDSADPTKHQIVGPMIINAGSYKILYADNDPSQGNDHLPLSLSSGGEDIVLTQADGVTVVDSYTYGAQTTDVSEGRCADDDTVWTSFTAPTPNAVNGGCNPIITNTGHTPQSPSTAQGVVVTTTVTDPVATLTSVTLFYNSAGSFISTPMVNTTGAIYQASIPATGTATQVEYYIEATNSNGLTVYDPLFAPTDTFLYFSGYTTPTLIINEFMASNDTTLEDPDEAGEYPDWIEIHNTGPGTIDLNNMYISDDIADLTNHQFTATLTIAPNDYLVLYADDDGTQGVDHLSFTLSAGGEDIVLTDADGVTVIDSYTYGTQTADVSEGRCPEDMTLWTFYTAATPASMNGGCAPVISNLQYTPVQPSTAQSVMISADATDNGSVTSMAIVYRVDGGAWVTVPMSLSGGVFGGWSGSIPAQTNGAFVEFYVTATDNDGLVGSDPTNAPTDVYSYFVAYTPPTLYINEFMASNATALEDPDEPTTYPDWIEIYNPSPNPVDLQGFYLTDQITDTTKYEITGTLTIAGNSHVVFYADDDSSQGILHTNFKLSASGEELALVGLDGVTVIDSVTFGPQATDVSMGLLPDGVHPIQTLACFTPGAFNTSCGFKIYLPILENQ